VGEGCKLSQITVVIIASDGYYSDISYEIDD
jgi:hypothetical protein